MMNRVGCCQIIYTYGKKWLLYFPLFLIFPSSLPLFFSILNKWCRVVFFLLLLPDNLYIAKKQTFLSHFNFLFPPFLGFFYAVLLFPIFMCCNYYFLQLFLSCSILPFFFPISLSSFPFFFSFHPFFQCNFPFSLSLFLLSSIPHLLSLCPVFLFSSPFRFIHFLFFSPVYFPLPRFPPPLTITRGVWSLSVTCICALISSTHINQPISDLQIQTSPEDGDRKKEKQSKTKKSKHNSKL